MIELEGYEIRGRVRASDHSVLLRARDIASGRTVLIKTTLSDAPAADELKNYQREFELTRTIESRHVLNARTLERHRQRVAIVFDDFEGEPLPRVVPQAGLDLETFFTLAPFLVRALAAIHERDVIHGAVCPENILVSQDSLVLLDFSHATQLAATPTTEMRVATEASGDLLPFMAPEQSGRMNRSVDHRADLYSLGATLYFMLCGSPPFEDPDPISLMHRHMTQVPTALHLVKADIPPTLSDIVLRLLEKDPDGRYRGALGLQADLERCWVEWRATGQIEPFELGEYDIPRRLLVPRKLYGRAEQLRTLDLAYDDAATTGAPQIVLIRGDEGIGKSELLRVAASRFAERGASVIFGHGDQLHETAPYSALRGAFSRLAQQMLSEPNEQLEHHRRVLLTAIEGQTSLLASTIPELVSVVGEAQSSASSSREPTGSERGLFVRLIEALAEQKPVALLLDDLEWVDAATLDLVFDLLTSRGSRKLLFVGTYRKAELGEDHPLKMGLSFLQRAGVEPRELYLFELAGSEVTSLVADILGTKPDALGELPKLISERAGGVPLFINELLSHLRDEQLLTFSHTSRSWKWNPRADTRIGLPESAIELLLLKLKRLPRPTLEVLQLAACVGQQFALVTLARMADRKVLIRSLATAVREGLLVHVSPRTITSADDARTWTSTYDNLTMAFRHDRIQQAALETLDEPQRARIHLQIARSIAAHPHPQRSNEVFELADHVNNARAAITEPMERLWAAKVCLEAGKRRARSPAARTDSYRYFEAGVAFLPADAWEKHPALSRALNLGFAEALHGSGAFEKARDRLDRILAMEQSKVELARVHLLQVELQVRAEHYDEALKYGAQGLSVLGLKRETEVRRTFRSWQKRSAVAPPNLIVSSLEDGEDDQKSAHLAAVDLLSEMLPAALFVDLNRYYALGAQCLKVGQRYGATPRIALAYQAFAEFLVAQNEIELGLESCAAARSLSERSDSFELRGRLLLRQAMTTDHWEKSSRRLLSNFRQATEFCADAGDMVFHVLGAAYAPSMALLLGEPLPEILRECGHAGKLAQRYRVSWRQEPIEAVNFVANHLGDTAAELDLPAGPAGVPPSTETNSAWGEVDQTLERLGQLMVAVILNRTATIQHLLDEPLASSQPVLLAATELVFFKGIAQAHLARVRPKEADRYKAHLKASCGRLEAWADIQPETYRHKYLLLRAELAALSKNTARALEAYDEAIAHAQDSRSIPHRALACELCGRFLLRQRSRLGARAYLEEAYQSYQAWGATKKTHALASEFGWLLPPPPSEEHQLESPGRVGSPHVPQPISSEIDIRRLLRQIMTNLLRTAGADSGAIAIATQDQMRIEAVAHRGGEEVLVFEQGEPLDESPHISRSIARYVLRTGENVVIRDARNDDTFSTDAFLKKNDSRSVLCTPIRHQNRNIGVLFLENRLAAHAFTEDRVEMLRLLVSQVAVSLLNARLFEETKKLNESLRQENQERVRAEMERRASERRLATFLEELPVGVVVWRKDSTIYLSNRMARETLRLKGEPTIQQPHELPPPEGLLFREALKGRIISGKDEELVVGNRKLPVSVWASPLFDANGQVEFAITAFQDISERQEAEARQLRLERQLRQAQKLESIGRLAGGVAHDFNNLLIPITCYVDFALETLSPDDPLAEDLQEVVRAANQAAALTQQLLAFSRNQVLEVQNIDINHEIHEMRRLLERLIRENIEVTYELEADPGLIRADAAQLRQVVMNLAINASDAMPQGGKLKISTRNARVDENEGSAHPPVPSGLYVELCVADTGTGIDSEHIERVFDPFFTTKAPGQGTGLGLAMVYGVVKQHRGQIQVDSTLGSGTTFTLRFPQLEEAALADQPEETREDVSDLQKAHVLVVEDQDSVRELIIRILKNAGHEVVALDDPGKVVDLLEKHSWKIDLLVTDVVMPSMSGPELYEKLQAHDPGLRVLFVSGYTDMSRQDLGALDPQTNFLRKPFTVKEFRKKVAAVLQSDDQIKS